ncbi:hypothetical protein BC628DRAFT_1407290 [Trametes gibbosa]|nr:hypothetical protein BC628DRAFT_1407290 [Trametes gibbosa]
MSSSEDIEFVDDTNPRVQYQPGWEWDQGLAEVDTTRHGASTEGLKAWLSFTGAGVRVIGTLGDSNTYGQPKTTYLVDGKVAGSYSAPFVGETQYNVTFFSMRNLSPGDHVVLINNTDGTRPNQFLLDYFLIDKIPNPSSDSAPTSPPALIITQPAASPNPPTSTHSSSTLNTASNPSPSPTTHSSSVSSPSMSSRSTPSPVSISQGSTSHSDPVPSTQSQTVASGSASTSGPAAATSPVGLVTTLNGFETAVSTMTVPVSLTEALATHTNAPAPDIAVHSSHSNVAIIAGAAVAGICALAALALLLFCLRHRRQKASQVVPFAPSQTQHTDAAPPVEQKPSMRRTMTLPVTVSHRSVNDDGQTEFARSHSAASPESIASFSEQSQSSETALPIPARFAFRNDTPYISPLFRQSSQTTEKPHSPISPGTTSDEYLGLHSADVQSTSMPGTPYTPYSPDSQVPASTSRTSLIPTAVVPPGEWHAPPDSHSRARVLLRSLFSREPRSSNSIVDAIPVAHDVDSGLRLYNDVVLPPPYTQD